MKEIMFDPAQNTKETSLTWLTLFATTGTLVCCALPIMLVTLGMGATVAAMVTAIPFLVTLSQHKILVFGISAVMLALAGRMMYRPGRACPTDPDFYMNRLAGLTDFKGLFDGQDTSCCH